jgi:hypothetical protein
MGRILVPTTKKVAKEKYLSFRLREDRSDYIREYEGDIVLSNADRGSAEVIGYIECTFFDIDKADQDGANWRDLFDPHSSDSSGCELLYAKDGDLFDLKLLYQFDEIGGSLNLLVVNRIGIFASHRGENQGLRALCAIVPFLRVDVSFLVLEAAPLQFGRHQLPSHIDRQMGYNLLTTESKQADQKLEQHYEKSGFIRFIPGSHMMVVASYILEKRERHL